MRCQCQRDKIVRAKLDAIPKRFEDSRLTNYVPMDSKQQAVLDTVAKDFTKNFFFHGNYGRGKTHLAVAQYVELVKIERPCCFISIHDLVSELRRSEMDPDYFCTVRQRVRHEKQFHVIVDDLDKFKPTDFRFEALYDFFNKIYANKLGLTITSNYSLQQLAEANLLDGAILRRIDEICEAVEV